MKKKNAAAQALGSLGGKARKAKLSPEELRAQSQHALRARWDGTTFEERRAQTAAATRARRKK